MNLNNKGNRHTKIKSVLLHLASALLFLLLPSIISFGFSSNSSIVIEASTRSIASNSKNNDNELAYSRFFINDDNGGNNTKDLYRGIYKYNFLNSTNLLTYADSEHTDNLYFPLEIDGKPISNGVVAVDMVNYSTLENTVRFETACMNLYKYRNRIKETNFANCDGFIYIPDYLADLIIYNSINKYRCYDDLIHDDSEIKINSSVYGKIKCYKIANIFHVKGFNDSYISSSYSPTINDYNNGKKMLDFLGDFVVLFDYELSKANNYVLNSMIAPKQFSIREFTSLLSNNNRNKVQGSFFVVKTGIVSPIDSSGLVSSINGYGYVPIIKIITSIVGIMSAAVFLFVRCFLLLRKKPFIKGIRPLEPLLLLVFNLIFQLIYSSIGSFSFVFLLFYSSAFTLPSVLLILTYYIVYFINLWRTRDVY